MFVKQIDALNKKLVDAEACVERAENKAADADKLLQQSKKRENALTSKLETAYAEIDELMQLVPEETELTAAPGTGPGWWLLAPGWWFHGG